MPDGKWAGSWAGSGQTRPFSSRPITHAELEALAEEHLAALRKHGASHVITEAYRQSLERAVANWNETHKTQRGMP